MDNDGNSVGAVKKRLRNELSPMYGERETESLIRLIFEHIMGWSPVDLVMRSDYELADFTVSKIADISNRLLSHEPIQYILGEARFFGCNFKVNRHTLIPRPETEELVQIILDCYGDTPDLRVLDIATGSGCIAIALARNLRFASVTATDISPDAVAVAKENAARLKANVKCVAADVFAMTPEIDSYDIIVSNPPYICRSEAHAMERNVLDFEPHPALFVDDNDPLVFYRAILKYAVKTLRPGGRVFFEINPLFADDLQKIAIKSGFSEIDLTLDIHRRKRFLTARKV